MHLLTFSLIKKAIKKCSKKKAKKMDNISAITVVFDEEPRENQHLSEDELSSGFTTVPASPEASERLLDNSSSTSSCQ